jgi:hypothetical protein
MLNKSGVFNQNGASYIYVEVVRGEGWGYYYKTHISCFYVRVMLK